MQSIAQSLAQFISTKNVSDSAMFEQKMTNEQHAQPQ